MGLRSAPLIRPIPSDRDRPVAWSFSREQVTQKGFNPFAHIEPGGVDWLIAYQFEYLQDGKPVLEYVIVVYNARRHQYKYFINIEEVTEGAQGNYRFQVAAILARALIAGDPNGRDLMMAFMLINGPQRTAEYDPPWKLHSAIVDWSNTSSWFE